MKRTLLVWTLIASTLAHGEASVGGRHIVLLQADLENLWGIYYFGVHNNGNEPAALSARVVLPLETIDFKPYEGLTPEDIKLDPSGAVLISRTFAPGMSLVGVGFQVPLSAGGSLTWDLKQPLAEFSVAVPAESGLQLKAKELMKPGLPAMLAGGNYQGLVNTQPIAAGTMLRVTVEGFPQGRTPFWIVGAVFATLLLTLGLGLARLRRPGMEQPC